MILRLVLCCLIAGIAAPLHAQTKIIPAEWLPALAPSIKSALDELRRATASAEMNQASRNVAEMTDAQLFIAYVRLYEKLPAKEREKLYQEQTEWLKKRPAVAKKAGKGDGGSVAPLEANNAEVTYTEKRLAELRARFKALSAKNRPSDDDE